jgi:chromate transport protein ChrA
MHQELVERRRWISERRFLHALNYCMLLPGPEAQQLATYIGWLMHRTWGGIDGRRAVRAASLFILIALSWLYIAFGDVPLVAGLFYGIKPAVVAIVLHAAWRIGSRALKNGVAVGDRGAAFVAIFAFDMPFPGSCWRRRSSGYRRPLAPAKFARRRPRRRQQVTYGPALIDDDTPPPPHARFSLAAAGARGLIGRACCGSLPMALLLALRLAGHADADGLVLHQGRLLTFGGAYAVLPYVYQGGVEHYGWLTAPQMMDGLALGETTPGPLIMVVAFVGFVGGVAKAVRAGRPVRLGPARRRAGDLVHLPAQLPVHPRRRPAGRIDARRPQIHRAADRHHRRRGRRDPQSGAVLRLPRAVAAPSASTQMLAGEECHHQMTTSSDLAAIGAEVSADDNANPHGNCGICHFSCCSTLPIGTAIVAVFAVSETFSFAVLVQPPAPPAARPERPNWASLA